MVDDFTKKSDEELAVLVVSQDELFGILIDRYEKKLKAYICRISGLRNDDVEDLLQDVFIAAYQNICSFDKDMKFSSWIYRIAHNKTISRWRKHKKEINNISIENNIGFVESVFFEDNLLGDLERAEMSENLVKVILKLPIKYKDILVLRFMEEKSYDEISDIIKSPISTVGTLVRRAKLKLKKELLKTGFDFDLK